MLTHAGVDSRTQSIFVIICLFLGILLHWFEHIMLLFNRIAILLSYLHSVIIYKMIYLSILRLIHRLHWKMKRFEGQLGIFC